MNFTNKNVLITGGTTGIGLATAKEFIKSGANVWITGRNRENLENASKEINSLNLKSIAADTANLSDLSLLEKAFAESGNKLDTLFLNAGIATFSSIEEVTEADFDAQFNTNVKGHFFTLQKMLPYLAEDSSVIFTSSTVPSLVR